MPTRNVNLTEHFDRFIDDGVSSGRFSNASEMVREGLRLLEQRQEEDRARIEWLRGPAQEGIDAIERGDVTSFDSSEEMRPSCASRRENRSFGSTTPRGRKSAVPNDAAYRVELAEPCGTRLRRDHRLDGLDVLGTTRAGTIRRSCGASPGRFGERSVSASARAPVAGNAAGLLTYHLASSRRDSRSSAGNGEEAAPLLLYRPTEQIVTSSAFVHDAPDLLRHVPEDD